jgi:tryptophan halogenase
LESTAIQFVDFACRRLLQCLPSCDFEPEPIAKFNTQMVSLYEDVRDFLGLHFTLGDRDDTPYWRAARHEAKRSDRLQECLALWRYSLPDVYDPRSGEIFNFWSAACVLFGKGFYTEPPSAGSDLLPQQMWERYVHDLGNMRRGLLARLPDHFQSLLAMAQTAVPGESASAPSARRSLPSKAVALGMPPPVMAPGA